MLFRCTVLYKSMTFCSRDVASRPLPTFDMSKSSKSLSGLKSVTRDWSEPKSSQPSDGELIDWPPTQPNIGLTPAERRLKIIQDALAEPESPPERVFTKRPAPLSPQQQPPAKKRQLPSNWSNPQKPATSASLSSTTWSASSSSMSAGTVRSAPVSRSSAPASRDASSGKSKVASVFLSSEQTQILKLVQEGHNVFHTGSAGERDSLYSAINGFIVE
jgi:hypothetical protein